MLRVRGRRVAGGGKLSSLGPLPQDTEGGSCGRGGGDGVSSGALGSDTLGSNGTLGSEASGSSEPANGVPPVSVV